MKKKTILTEKNVTWIEFNGEDYGTGVVFENETFGIYNDGSIVDSENYPVESDNVAIAIKNHI